MPEQSPTVTIEPVVQTPPAAQTPQVPPTTETPKSPETTTAPPPKDGEKSVLNQDDKGDAKVPETYADWKLPDGYKLDEKVAPEINKMFKELGLTQDAGQKLVDFYTKQTAESEQAPYKLWADTQKEWKTSIEKTYTPQQLTDIKADFSRTMAILDPTVAKNFRAAMDHTGAGNHPAFVAAFKELASKLTEGKFFNGKNPAPEGQKVPGAAERPSAAEALYPSMKS